MAGLLDYASSIAGEAKNYASSVADEAKKNVQGLLADPKQQLMKTLNNLTARVAASQAKTKAAWATGDPKVIAQNAWDSSQTALGFAPLGMIKLKHGRIPETYVEANKLRDAIYNQLKKTGNDLSYGDSLVSPSRYVSTSFPPQSSNWADELSLRLSNHGDVNGFNSNPAAGKLSVDPKTGLTFEDAVRWLNSNGYDMGGLLSTANKKYPARDVIPPAYFSGKGQ